MVTVSTNTSPTIFQSNYFFPHLQKMRKMWGPKVLSLVYCILRCVGGQEQMTRKDSYLVTCFHKMTLVAHPEFLIHRLSTHSTNLRGQVGWMQTTRYWLDLATFGCWFCQNNWPFKWIQSFWKSFCGCRHSHSLT